MEVVSGVSFKELTDRAKQHAIEKYAEPEYEWWDSTIEYYKEEGEAKGFSIDNVAFSGFSSQGDGASWTGSIDMSVWFRAKCATAQGTDVVKYEALAAITEEGWCEKYARIETKGHYYHEYTMHCSWDALAYAEMYTQESDVLKTGVLAGASISVLVDMYASEADAIEEEVLEAARDYAREIYKALETEYESSFEEECFAEMAEANEWKFDEEGNMA